MCRRLFLLQTVLASYLIVDMRGCPIRITAARGSFYSHSLKVRPRLFERWIELSTGQITIHRISIWKTSCVIHWIDFYLVDSPIQRWNKRVRVIAYGR